MKKYKPVMNFGLGTGWEVRWASLIEFTMIGRGLGFAITFGFGLPPPVGLGINFAYNNKLCLTLIKIGLDYSNPRSNFYFFRGFDSLIFRCTMTQKRMKLRIRFLKDKFYF